VFPDKLLGDSKVSEMRHTRIVVLHYGGPEVLTTIEEDIPTPNSDEVRAKVLAAGVSLPDILAREGVHPETPRVPYTPGWDLVGTVDRLGDRVNGFELGQKIAAMPIHGCYAQYVCLPQRKLVPVPEGLDAAEAVAVVPNYVTAGVEMYGTCSAKGVAVVRQLGGIPIDYKNADFVKEIHRLVGDGVDAVFDGIGGDNLWRSRDALREGGCVVTYGFQSKLSGGRIASGGGRHHPIRESAELGWFVVRNWFKPGRKRMAPYSIQWLMRLRPAWFRHDLLTLMDLLKEGKIKPLIAERLPQEGARRAHEMLGEGGVVGKIVLVPNG
jgi:NADPH2:quinone reductase